MQYHQQLAVVNLITYSVAFLISMLGQVRIVGDYNMAEISAKYETGITPASFTFSIWGIIYTLLFIMLIVHLVQAFRKPAQDVISREIIIIGPLFIVNQIAIAVWVYTWLNDMPGISLLLLGVQFYTLFIIHRRLNTLNPKTGKLSLFVTQLPLSIYFGWISIALLANFASWLSSLGWLTNPAVNLYLSGVLLISAGVVGVLVVYFKHNIFYSLVIIWATYGIISKRIDDENVLFDSLIYIGIIVIVVNLLGIIKTTLAFNNIREKPYYFKRKVENTFKSNQ